MSVIKTKLYNGEVELTLETFKHTYTYNGKKVTSVTQALGIINKPALISWAANTAIEYVSIQIEPGKSYDEIQLAAIWEAGKKAHWQKKTDAGNLGSFVHKWVEQYIKGENPATPVNPELQESVNKFLTWVKKHSVEFLLSEQQIYSKKYNYTGTLDFICKIDGKMYIGDLKTSNGIYPEMLIQTAAYRYARVEEFPQEEYVGQLILRIGKDGTFEFAVMRDEGWYSKMFVAFLSALKLQESMEAIKEFKVENE